jgi:hypothetical protein
VPFVFLYGDLRLWLIEDFSLFPGVNKKEASHELDMRGWVIDLRDFT